MRCKECDMECTCHINPPCSLCTSHSLCDICNEFICEDAPTFSVQIAADDIADNVCEKCAENFSEKEVTKND